MYTTNAKYFTVRCKGVFFFWGGGGGGWCVLDMLLVVSVVGFWGCLFVCCFCLFC